MKFRIVGPGEEVPLEVWLEQLDGEDRVRLCVRLPNGVSQAIASLDEDGLRLIPCILGGHLPQDEQSLKIKLA